MCVIYLPELNKDIIQKSLLVETLKNLNEVIYMPILSPVSCRVLLWEDTGEEERVLSGAKS